MPVNTGIVINYLKYMICQIKLLDWDFVIWSFIFDSIVSDRLILLNLHHDEYDDRQDNPI